MFLHEQLKLYGKLHTTWSSGRLFLLAMMFYAAIFQNILVIHKKLVHENLTLIQVTQV